MKSIRQLANEVERIKDRNRKVEGDKAWETSSTRKVLLMAFIYMAVGLYLNAIAIPNPWLNAIVPSVGFMLSTLTLPFFKDLWLKHIYRA